MPEESNDAQPREVETKTSSFEKRYSGVQPVEVQETIKLLQNERNENSYLADASGFLSQFLVEVNASRFSDLRESKLKPAVDALAEYAVQTNNGRLAEYLFNRLPPADKWFLYATAYDAATLPPSQLASWRTSLDAGKETGANNKDAVIAAARSLALTEISIHNYREADDPQLEQTYKEEIEAQKKTFKSVITPTYEGGSNAYDRSTLTLGMQEEYNERFNIAFAKAGLWEDVEEIDRFYPWNHDKARERNSQLMCKALAGQLSKKDQRLLKRAGATGAVLRWIDGQRKGDDVPQPNVEHLPHPIQDQPLLEILAPQLVKQLDLNPRTHLRALKLHLATGDFEEAESIYAWMTQNTINPLEALQATLLMAKHDFDLQAAKAAHEVYNDAFIREVIPLEVAAESFLQEEDPVGHAVFRERLHELYSKVYQLRGPEEKMLAQARLALLYRRAAPDMDEGRYLLDNVQSEWSAFEQREGYWEKLPLLANSLQKLGLHFIKRWKYLDHGGYRGYEPIPDREDLDERSKTVLAITSEGIYVPDQDIKFWEKAAPALNNMVGEERYVVEVHKETRPAERESYFNETDRRITLHGSWPLYGNYSEIFNAVEHIDRGEKLQTRPELTQKLDEIMSQVIETPAPGQQEHMGGDVRQ